MVTRVQGVARGSTLGSPTTVTLNSPPTNGNVLIAVIGLVGSSGVSSISQTGVTTWSRQAQKIAASGVISEIWLGTVGSGASKTLTVYSDCTTSYRQQVNVCEYSGIVASPLDKTAVNAGLSTSGNTGTTATTAQAHELWIGGITGCSTTPPTQSSPTNGFALFDGSTEVYTYAHQSVGYLEKVVSSTGQANSGVSFPDNTNWAGCIATFKASSGTIVVPYDGRYAGVGSKQTTVWWNGADTIMQVQSNVPSNLDKSAVIENLIIDGTGSTNATGILLENVYNCYIRNITIKNCDVGIKVRITGSNWSHANRFEHIRMINVKTGILFTGTSSNKDFSFTTIDDVGISLKNDSAAIGIKIGDPYANLYNTFIKATIWLDTSNGTGMVVNGQLKLSLVNLEVEEPSQSYNGKGLQVNSGAYVTDNQSFLLTTGGIKTSPDYRVINYGTIDPEPYFVLRSF